MKRMGCAKNASHSLFVVIKKMMSQNEKTGDNAYVQPMEPLGSPGILRNSRTDIKIPLSNIFERRRWRKKGENGGRSGR